MITSNYLSSPLHSFQVKQVFSDLDFLGWYTTGESTNESDIKIHKQICEINESPVFMKLNPQARHTDVNIELLRISSGLVLVNKVAEINGGVFHLLASGYNV